MGSRTRPHPGTVLGLHADRLVQAPEAQRLSQYAGRWCSFAWPRCPGRAMADQGTGRPRLRYRVGWHRHRTGPAPGPTIPLPLFHARQQPLRLAVHDQPGQVAAQGRRHFLGTAEDTQRLGQPLACTGPDAMTRPHTAIVTGGSAGIGAEICRQTLNAGYEVISMARRPPDFTHARLHSVLVDLLDAEATAQASAELARQHEVSHVVHNAGVIWPHLLPEVTLQELQVLTQIHLGAAISIVQAVLPAM